MVRLVMFLFVSKLAFFLLILRSLSGPREYMCGCQQKIEEQGERARARPGQESRRLINPVQPPPPRPAPSIEIVARHGLQLETCRSKGRKIYIAGAHNKLLRRRPCCTLHFEHLKNVAYY